MLLWNQRDDLSWVPMRSAPGRGRGGQHWSARKSGNRTRYAGVSLMRRLERSTHCLSRSRDFQRRRAARLFRVEGSHGRYPFVGRGWSFVCRRSTGSTRRLTAATGCHLRPENFTAAQTGTDGPWPAIPVQGKCSSCMNPTLHPEAEQPASKSESFSVEEATVPSTRSSCA
jgi:hypothetical protein